jgi:hypothetical protein
MAGIATTATEPLVEHTPDALAFEIDRAHYRFHFGLFALFILAIVAVMIAVPGYLTAITLAAGVVVFASVLASIARIALLPGPILVIDRRGIFDRRLTREVVPWSKISRVDVQEINNRETARPNSFLVRIDVGSRRRAGIALAPWTYFDLPRCGGGIGWDDLVIDVQGLAMTPNPGEAVVAGRIVGYARKMLARSRRAGEAPRAD